MKSVFAGLYFVVMLFLTAVAVHFGWRLVLSASADGTKIVVGSGTDAYTLPGTGLGVYAGLLSARSSLKRAEKRELARTVMRAARERNPRSLCPAYPCNSRFIVTST